MVVELVLTTRCLPQLQSLAAVVENNLGAVALQVEGQFGQVAQRSTHGILPLARAVQHEETAAAGTGDLAAQRASPERGGIQLVDRRRC